MREIEQIFEKEKYMDLLLEADSEKEDDSWNHREQYPFLCEM